MNEREQLLSNIANCAEIMKAIGQKEYEIDSIEKKIENIKPLCGMKGIFVYVIIAVAFCQLTMPKQLELSFFVIIGFPILCVILAKRKQKSLYEQIDKINEEIAVLQNDSSLLWLPVKYRHTFAYRNIADYLNNMRANNLQEALNLYETELHQTRLEIYSAVGNLNSR